MVSPQGESVAYRGHVAKSGDMFRCYIWRGGFAIDSEWVKARDAGEQPILNQTMIQPQCQQNQDWKTYLSMKDPACQCVCLYQWFSTGG